MIMIDLVGLYCLGSMLAHRQWMRREVGSALIRGQVLEVHRSDDLATRVGCMAEQHSAELAGPNKWLN